MITLLDVCDVLLDWWVRELFCASTIRLHHAFA